VRVFAAFDNCMLLYDIRQYDKLTLGLLTPRGVNDFRFERNGLLSVLAAFAVNEFVPVL
jgi:hypothetical protein